METTKKFNAKSVKQFLGNNAIIILLVAIAIGVGFARPAFFKPANMVNLMKNASIRYIIALGISGCLITTGNDLSAGRTVGFAACIAAIFLQRADYPDRFYPGMPELPLFAVLLIVMAICAVIGMCNGLVVSYLKVQPFIATLGMQTIVYGICLVYTGARPIGGLREDFTNLANKGVFGTGFSYVFVFAIVIFAFMWFLYNKTRHGKYMYAIGGNENAAEVAGVNVPRTKIKIYMLASMLFAVAGFLMAAKSGGASVNTAQGYELDAIAACTIGGVSTTGGIGRVSGIFVGVLVFELLKIAMQFMGVETSYTYIVQGLVIIVAVAMDIRKYLAKK